MRLYGRLRSPGLGYIGLGTTLDMTEIVQVSNMYICIILATNYAEFVVMAASLGAECCSYVELL